MPLGPFCAVALVTSVWLLLETHSLAAAQVDSSPECTIQRLQQPPVYPVFNTCEAVGMNSRVTNAHFVSKRFFSHGATIFSATKCMNSTLGAWQRYVKIPSADYMDRVLITPCPRITPKIHVFTLLTNALHKACMMLQSAALNAIPLQIYGWGLEDFSIMNKIQMAANIMSTIPRDEYVLFVDGMDVLFNANLSCIWGAFAALELDAVFGAEGCCSIRALGNRVTECPSHFPYTHSPWRFFNSGTYMGKAGRLADLMQDTLKEQWTETTNDQDILGKVYVDRQDQYHLGLDTHAILFQCWLGSKRFFLCNRPTQGVNCLLGTMPKIFHFPAKQDISYHSRWMWWYGQLANESYQFRVNADKYLTLEELSCRGRLKGKRALFGAQVH
uniref:PLOD1-3-like GT domain-containing protein n=1 Tax=Eutreptiella gymnastica TaxID=73025 RepID=A0A7S4FER1_9EUGL